MDINNSQEPQNKEKEMFIEIYDQCIDQIFRFIYYKIGSKEEAQDLTSATFLKTWNHIQQNGINQKTLKPLLYKIARNAVVDYYRSKSNQTNFVNIEEAANVEDENQDIHSRSMALSDFQLVEKNLTKLKDEYREIIILKYTEEFSVSEIAEILEKTKTNTRVLLFRALRALKEIINSGEKK